MVIVMYGPAIQEAIASGDLRKMKALRKEARTHLKEYGNISVALEVLEAEIKKTEFANKRKR